MDMPVVRDPEGQVRTWDWLLSVLGPLRIERAAVEGLGQPVFRLQHVRLAKGPAVLVVRVCDAQGIPFQGADVVRSWAGAPGLPAWPAPASSWQSRGVHGPTGRDGAVGFGLGEGDVYQLPGAGPASIWVADPAGPSDCIHGLGLLASEEPLHLDVSFRLVQELASILSDTEPGLLLSQSAAAVSEPPSPPAPPPAPLRLTGEQWSLLLDRLDRVIQVLEEQAGD